MSAQTLSYRPSIGHALATLFPEGTSEEASGNIDPCPIYPMDLFAAAAFLLQRSGAYQYIVAPFVHSDPATERSFGYQGSTSALSRAEIEETVRFGALWRTEPERAYREAISPIWRELLAHREAVLVEELIPGSPPPAWWRLAHRLLIVADEACADVGYLTASTAGSTEKHNWVTRFVAVLLQRWQDHRTVSQDHYSRHKSLDTVAVMVDRHVARVLPKGRTAGLGVAMRTLSHNLTLLPPHGTPRIYWHSPGAPSLGTDNERRGRLNLLLIPFPYSIPVASFVGSRTEESDRSWGRFKIHQTWIEHRGPDRSADEFASFVMALFARAEEGGEKVNGIILPEFALDWVHYDRLVQAIREADKDIEFLVSGVSMNCVGESGNQVTFSVFRRNTNAGGVLAETHSRRKHHRWCIDSGQARQYALNGSFGEDGIWWEHHEVAERVLHVDVFRAGSVFTAMICEDLARVDPVVSAIRAIGPNLIFALLMDGPQIKSRWPGLYATTLADDPGSSVLTLTSFGLVSLSGRTREATTGDPGRPVIALWKNYPGPAQPGHRHRSEPLEIELDRGSQAVLLKLRSERATETTIDDRMNSDATAWVIEPDQPVAQVSLTRQEFTDRGWTWIYSHDDVAAPVPATIPQ